MIALLLLACQQTIVDHKTQIVEQGTPPEDTAYLADLDSSPTPDLEVAQALLQQAIVDLSNVRLDGVLDVYFSMMENTDNACPRWYNDGNGLYWADTCQSQSNVSFQGVGTLNRYVDGTADENGNTWYGRQIYCEGVLENEDTRLSCGGNATQLYGTSSNGDDVFYLYSSSHTILFEQEIFVPEVESYASKNEFGEAIFYSALLPIDSGFVQFQQQLLSSFDCSLEPSGAQNIQVSDTGDSWLYVVWHGDEGQDSEQCDGCGDVYFQGEAIGSICVDFSSWLDWTNSPYE